MLCLHFSQTALEFWIGAHQGSDGSIHTYSNEAH